MIRYLAIAVERGLVEYSEVRDLYRTTEAGLLFLDKYARLLRLLPKIPVSPNLIRYEEEEKAEVRKEQKKKEEKIRLSVNQLGNELKKVLLQDCYTMRVLLASMILVNSG